MEKSKTPKLKRKSEVGRMLAYLAKGGTHADFIAGRIKSDRELTKQLIQSTGI